MMKKIESKLSYFEFIERIRSNPYLYVSVYNDAQKELTQKEFTLLQNKLAMGKTL